MYAKTFFDKRLNLIIWIIAFLLFAATTHSSYAVTTDTISLGKPREGYPIRSLALDDQAGLLYVTNSNLSTLFVIDLTTNEVKESIALEKEPAYVKVNQNTGKVYVGDSKSNTIFIVDPSQNNRVFSKTLTIPHEYVYEYGITGITINETTNKVYVLSNNRSLSSGTAAFISILDGQTDKIERSFKVSDLQHDYDVTEAARDIAVNSKTNTVYVITDFGNMYVIDGSDISKIDLKEQSQSAYRISINADANTIYVSNLNSGSILILNGESCKLIRTVEVGIQPTNIEFDSSRNQTYVANGVGLHDFSDLLSIIDNKSNEIVNKIPVGEYPVAIAYSHTKKIVYTANAYSNDISIIKLDEKIDKDGWQMGSLKSLDSIYQLRYKMTSGDITYMYADPISKSIKIAINSESAGQLTIEIPRYIMDSKDNISMDAAYQVFVGTVDSLKPAESKEIEHNEELRLLVIDYPAGSDTTISINGTYIVPEFDSGYPLIAAISIICGIVAAKRYRKGR